MEDGTGLGLLPLVRRKLFMVYFFFLATVPAFIIFGILILVAQDRLASYVHRNHPEVWTLLEEELKRGRIQLQWFPNNDYSCRMNKLLKSKYTHIIDDYIESQLTSIRYYRYFMYFVFAANVALAIMMVAC